MGLHTDMVKLINSCGLDPIAFFWGGTAGPYEMQQNPDELARFLHLLAAYGPFENHLEIGVAAGGTYRIMRELIDIKNSWVIDLRTHTHTDRFDGNVNDSDFDIMPADFFVGSSHSSDCKEWLASLGKKFQLVGIDGDHSLAGITQDFELVEPFLEIGSLVWFHDIHGPQQAEGVGQFWHKLTHKNDQYKVVLKTPTPPTGRPLGIGVLQKVK
jgi:predicted O-methyltransferase YrrM